MQNSFTSNLLEVIFIFDFWFLISEMIHQVSCKQLSSDIVAPLKQIMTCKQLSLWNFGESIQPFLVIDKAIIHSQFSLICNKTLIRRVLGISVFRLLFSLLDFVLDQTITFHIITLTFL